MDIHDTPSRVTATATAAQIAFTFNFLIFDDTDLVVEVDGIAATYASPAVGALQYDVSILVDDEGGTVTFGSGLIAGQQVVLQRAVPVVRNGSFPTTGPLSMLAFNEQIDRLVVHAQDARVDTGASPDDALRAEVATRLGRIAIDPRNPAFNAVGDGVTNDTGAVVAALSFAFAAGLPVDAGDALFAVSGTMLFSNETRLNIRRLRLKQLTPANDRKTLHLVNCQQLRIEGLEIDLGASASVGYMNTSAGLWIDGGVNHRIANVTVFGSGKNNGIAIHNTQRSTYANLVARDMAFSDAAATDDVLQGIWLNANTDCILSLPRVDNLTGNALFSGVPFVNLRTRGIACSGNVRCTILEPNVSNVDQGIDFTGSSGNRNCAVLGGRAYQCASVGLKFANSAVRCKAVGFTAERCGTHGFLISGPSEAALPFKTSFVDLIGCAALDIGYNNFPSSSEVGFGVEANAFDVSFPKGIRIIGCRAQDTQATKTMQYGFYSNVSFDADKRANELVDFISEGHTVAARLGDHRPVCRVTGNGTLALTSSVEAAVGWGGEVEDTMLMHSTSSNTELIIVPITGAYAIRARLVFAANATGYRRAKVTKNAVTSFLVSVTPVTGEETTILLNERVDLVAGDVVTILAEQNSGGALNLIKNSSYFEVELVRAS